ncbi:reverse transcriptase [Labeo rohita]|uniref:Reverse transcriptase n=1 Tax=Labeo rohita TaxID=84645 RepID=A0A498NMK6_LABRO|nr:reverse transcriptase [Labeo rohita]
MTELRNIGQGKLTTTRRAEWHRKRSKERARRRAEFIANPFGLTRRLLGQKCSGRLNYTPDEVNKYLSTSYSDIARDQDLEEAEEAEEAEGEDVEVKKLEEEDVEVKKLEEEDVELKKREG